MGEKKPYLDSIRESFLFFGHDTAHLSDEELEKRAIEGSKVIANTGITVNEASEYITIAIKAMR